MIVVEAAEPLSVPISNVEVEINGLCHKCSKTLMVLPHPGLRKIPPEMVFCVAD
jgi:hypothetical protein